MRQLVEATYALPAEGLIIVSGERDSIVKEFVELCDATLEDPAATIHLKGKKSVEKRVPHRKLGDVSLQAVRAEASGGIPYMPSDDGMISLRKNRSVYSQLGIIEPQGKMWVGIEHQQIGTIDFTHDPFTQYILDQFRSHFS